MGFYLRRSWRINPHPVRPDPSEISRAENRPRLIFDTSAINRLADDQDRRMLEAAIKAAFWFGLNGDAFEELVANTRPARRKELFNLCKQLVFSHGDCLLPRREVLKALAERHAKGNCFDWETVSVKCSEYGDELARQKFIDEKLAKAQKDSAGKVKDGFANAYGAARPHFQQLFQDHGTTPMSFAELIDALQVSGGAFWSTAGALYQTVSGNSLGETAAREFVGICPPFHALMVALCVAQYQRSIQDPPKPKHKAPGAFDLYMSIYLPYCDQFVTADAGQQMALADVASHCKLGAEVRSYAKFRTALLTPLAGR